MWKILFGIGEVFAKTETKESEGRDYKVEVENFGNITEFTGSNGVKLIADFVQKMYEYGAALIGIICVLVIVVSGIQIIFGGADNESVTAAKTRIFQSLFSLLLLFGSALLLHTINPGFFK